MSKTSGLGDNLLIAGYDLSGDIGSLDTVHGGPALLDVTGINKSAHERIAGLRDGSIEYTSYFNPTAGQEHPVLSALPRTDEVASYLRGTTLGSPAACCVGKQIDYAPTRANDGSLTVKSSVVGNAFGLEWGLQLTAGQRTDTTATAGTSIDTTASVSFGAQAYLQVTAFSGTDVTITIEDSANNSAFSAVTGLTFTAVTTAHTTQRLATSASGTIRRYLRATTSTSAGFTSVTFSVVINKNLTATVF